MPTTLHSATVPMLRQIVQAVHGLIDKAEAHAKEKGLEPAALIGARLAPDMHPFAFQIKQVASSTAGGVAAAISGEYRPGPAALSETFDALRAKLTEADAALAGIEADALNAAEGKDATIIVGETRIPFTAENFLTSFAIPNALFHATAAYAILRNQGVQIGKTDFLGKLATKG